MIHDHNKYVMAIGGIITTIVNEDMSDEDKLAWIQRTLLMYDLIEEEDLEIASPFSDATQK